MAAGSLWSIESRCCSRNSHCWQIRTAGAFNKTLLKKMLRQINRLTSDQRRDPPSDGIDSIGLAIQQCGIQWGIDSLVKSIPQIAGFERDVDTLNAVANDQLQIATVHRTTQHVYQF